MLPYAEEAVKLAAKEMDTMGDLAMLLRLLKDKDWSRSSVMYVVNEVFWEDEN